MKHSGNIQKLQETRDWKNNYKNKLDKACFVHDSTYSNSNDLAKRTISDRILKERVYEIPPNAKCDKY